MRKRIVTAAIAACLATGATAATGASAGSPASHSLTHSSGEANRAWRTEECRFGGLVPGGWTVREIVWTITCAERKWPVSGGVSKALAVARCESGLRADASNGGRYLGVYQHAAVYWPARLRSLAPSWDKALASSAFDGRSNVVIAMRMAHSGGWGPWSCA